MISGPARSCLSPSTGPRAGFDASADCLHVVVRLRQLLHAEPFELLKVDIVHSGGKVPRVETADDVIVLGCPVYESSEHRFDDHVLGRHRLRGVAERFWNKEKLLSRCELGGDLLFIHGNRLIGRTQRVLEVVVVDREHVECSGHPRPIRHGARTLIFVKKHRLTAGRLVNIRADLIRCDFKHVERYGRVAGLLVSEENALNRSCRVARVLGQMVCKGCQNRGPLRFPAGAQFMRVFAPYASG